MGGKGPPCPWGSARAGETTGAGVQTAAFLVGLGQWSVEHRYILCILLAPQPGPREPFLQELSWLHSLPSPSPFLSLSLVFSPPSYPSPSRSPSEPLNGRSGRPLSLRLPPPLPHPTAPGHGDSKECEEKPEARLRACALGRASPAQQPSTAKRLPYDGMRVGWGAQLGQGQCFQRGR